MSPVRLRSPAPESLRKTGRFEQPSSRPSSFRRSVPGFVPGSLLGPIELRSTRSPSAAVSMTQLPWLPMHSGRRPRVWLEDHRARCGSRYLLQQRRGIRWRPPLTAAAIFGWRCDRRCFLAPFRAPGPAKLAHLASGSSMGISRSVYELCSRAKLEVVRRLGRTEWPTSASAAMTPSGSQWSTKMSPERRADPDEGKRHGRGRCSRVISQGGDRCSSHPGG